MMRSAAILLVPLALAACAAPPMELRWREALGEHATQNAPAAPTTLAAQNAGTPESSNDLVPVIARAEGIQRSRVERPSHASEHSKAMFHIVKGTIPGSPRATRLHLLDWPADSEEALFSPGQLYTFRFTPTGQLFDIHEVPHPD